MLSPTGYCIAFGLQSAFCATVAFLATARGARRDLVLAWLVPAALITGLGYLDWAAQPIRETSLTSYVVGGVLTPLAAVSSAYGLRPHVSGRVRWIGAAASSFAVTLGVVVLAYTTGL